VPERKSKVDALARSLHRVAIILFLLFLASAVAAIFWVDQEYDQPDYWRFITAIANVGIFLVGAVVAQVGSALVESLGRVRASLIDAILAGRATPDEVERDWPESETSQL
jgi:hypothetical protein